MDHTAKRLQMVEQQLKARSIVDTGVLKAMSEVPRHEFVPSELRDIAYGDFPLPISDEQTISQPYIVALMTEALELKGPENVLEIGAGSGYQAAILSRLAKTVYTIERIDSLVSHAQSVLAKLSYLNVHVVAGDGSMGLKQHAPYDAIVVTAACPHVPKEYYSQLAEGGRLVVPVGSRTVQQLLKITREGDRFVERKLCDCMFVPLIGEDGWSE
ncbi:protein-L-isoaspartate(D-aspartate) O-methyltransferase [Nanoarchaeota archaeon]